MRVSIGKELSIDVDMTKFGLDESTMQPNAKYAMEMGLHNVLMDANASQTIKDNPNDWQEKSMAASQKKLDALYVGDIRSSGGGGRIGDPVRAEAIRMAEMDIKAAWRKTGKKLVDLENLRDKAVELIGKRAHYMTAAAERVAAMAERETVDLTELGL